MVNQQTNIDLGKPHFLRHVYYCQGNTVASFINTISTMPAYYEMSETRMVSHEHKYLAV